MPPRLSTHGPMAWRTRTRHAAHSMPLHWRLISCSALPAWALRLACSPHRSRGCTCRQANRTDDVRGHLHPHTTIEVEEVNVWWVAFHSTVQTKRCVHCEHKLICVEMCVHVARVSERSHLCVSTRKRLSKWQRLTGAHIHNNADRNVALCVSRRGVVGWHCWCGERAGKRFDLNHKVGATHSANSAVNSATHRALYNEQTIAAADRCDIVRITHVR